MSEGAPNPVEALELIERLLRVVRFDDLRNVADAYKVARAALEADRG